MADLDADLVTLCPSTDADTVRDLIDTDLTDAQINFFLNMAYRMSLQLSGELDECGGTDMQCDIIAVLAAHLIATMPNDGSVKSESVAGEWSVTYRGQDGKGLEASLYGQQALLMDCSGILSQLGLRGASFTVGTYERIEDLNPDG